MIAIVRASAPVHTGGGVRASPVLKAQLVQVRRAPLMHLNASAVDTFLCMAVVCQLVQNCIWLLALGCLGEVIRGHALLAVCS